jgi:fluoroacetyl-CoA thioesterase
MKETLVVGITYESTHTVTKEMSPPHLPMVVLSTPTMVGMIEGACMLSLEGQLDPGELTVGTHVCVSHESAVREGEQLVIRSRLSAIERRRLTFEVDVQGPRGSVSRGTHQRAVVDAARMSGG